MGRVGAGSGAQLHRTSIGEGRRNIGSGVYIR